MLQKCRIGELRYEGAIAIAVLVLYGSYDRCSFNRRLRLPHDVMPNAKKYALISVYA